ncbi:MAG: hypothetical protein OIF56_14970 [Cohaesibacter sp.]|nr:hypothetical protein [Cohaesibacter sp.]
MSGLLKVADAEILPPSDLEFIGESARAGLDGVTRGGLGWPAHYSHCKVEKTAAADVVRITPGEVHVSGIVYKADLAQDLDLQAFKPLLSSDEIWAAILLSGDVETTTENRPFETGLEPLKESKVVVQPTPKIERRIMRVSPQMGAPAPVAVKPAIAENHCCVAYVLLKKTGVERVEANETARVKTVYELDKRQTIVEVDLRALSKATETLQTDLAGVAAKVKAGPQNWWADQITNDVARLIREANIPSNAHNYFFDQGLVPVHWDLDHPDAQFRINEGIWPSYIKEVTEPLTPVNRNDPNVVRYGDFVLPDHDLIYREVVPLGNSSENISNAIHVIRTARQVTESHTSTSYGSTFRQCENGVGWGALKGSRAGQTFARKGQTFVALGHSADPWNNDSRSVGHKNHLVRQVFTRSYTTSYTVYDTKRVGLSGASYFQTFPSSQFAVCLGISLYFKSVGSAEDVTLCLCEVLPTGLPNFDRIIKTSTVQHKDLKVGWVDFKTDPWVRQPGKRYAWFTITSGNHSIAKTTNNAFPHGTAGKSVDGAWAQGSIMEDYSFREIVGKFKNNRTEVLFDPIALDGGMTELHLIYRKVIEGQSDIVWEAKPYGGSEWVLIEDDHDATAFDNLPRQMSLRATLVGTPDIAPILVLNADARVTVGRMQRSMRAITKVIDFDNPTNDVSIIVNMDAFDANKHTCTPKLILPDGTVKDADSISFVKDRDKTSRTKFKADFDLSAPITSGRLRLDTSSTDVTSIPFGQDIQSNFF